MNYIFIIFYLIFLYFFLFHSFFHSFSLDFFFLAHVNFCFTFNLIDLCVFFSVQNPLRGQPNRTFNSGIIFPSIHTERSIKYQFIPSVSIFYFLFFSLSFNISHSFLLSTLIICGGNSERKRRNNYTSRSPHLIISQQTSFKVLIQYYGIHWFQSISTFSFPFSSFCVPFSALSLSTWNSSDTLNNTAKHYKSNFFWTWIELYRLQ